MVTVYFFGKPYRVSRDLTVLQAMHAVGLSLTHGVGCQSGVCGACAIIYRVGDSPKLHTGLACRTLVQEGMTVAAFGGHYPKTPCYRADDLTAQTVVSSLYPQIADCIGCDACTRACPQELAVKTLVHLAAKDQTEAVAKGSASCVQCGLCKTRCPKDIDPSQVFLLSRRLHARQTPLFSETPEEREAAWLSEIKALTALSDDQLKERYADRDIEP